ncbi:hypothetical protein BV20DRAFT_712039 [Pilatotrama ljubarskyi]|nr:hypothetical protein BV20DRAFT_712039 [Pilatotrama ljubarskyi]
MHPSRCKSQALSPSPSPSMSATGACWRASTRHAPASRTLVFSTPPGAYALASVEEPSGGAGQTTSSAPRAGLLAVLQMTGAADRISAAGLGRLSLH